MAVNCDGERTQRMVIGSCNPNAFVGAWAREQGLTVVDSLPFPDVGGLVVVELPYGIDPNSEPPLIREKIKQDTINYFVEEDFLIRLTPRSLSPLSTVRSVQDGRQYYTITDTVAFPAQYVGPATCEALQFRPGVAMPSTAGGDNIVVTVIDSGADTLLSSAVWDRHAYRGSSTPFVQSDGLGYDFINGDFSPDDQLGHGTAVAGAIVSNYRGSRPLTLVHYKIFNGYGEATYFGAITAIYAAVQNGSDIINLSWGIPTEETPLALQCAIDYANDQGVIVVTSAGNETANVDTDPQWPAAYAGQDTFPNLITVASYVDENDALSLASFSNFGAQSVTLAAYAAAEAPKLGATATGSTVYGTDVVYGTSISTPLVTRELATILSNLPPDDSTAIDHLLALLQQQLQADQTRNGGVLLPLQCTTVP
ncbi:S8 family serine peptidase [Neolewinella sp.]|uniref:S8 family serine peptidase n=1 Tax=Neolewinella sp. TaxID=2993543 RepID=UPI003B51D396